MTKTTPTRSPAFLRRTVCAVLGLTASLAALPGGAQTAYPTRPVTIVVPGAAGGLTDQVGRLVARRVTELLGQAVVVEPRTGAGGNVAAESVARAAPDGYTLLLGSQGTQATNPFLYKNVRFDTERDFVPVQGVISLPNVLVVHPQVPVHNVRELVELARREPGRLKASSGGNGTGTHLAAELFQSVAGVKFLHIPYKGSAPSITDLLGGQVDLTFDYLVTTQSHVDAGKMRALAVTGPTRLPSLPQVPTIAEAGYPQAESISWLGLFFPAKTPAPIVERWQTEVARVLQEPATIEAIHRMGGVPLTLSGAQFGSYVTAERVKWKSVIERSGAKVD